MVKNFFLKVNTKAYVGSFSNARFYKSMMQQRKWNLHHSNLAICVAYYIVSRGAMAVGPYNDSIGCRSEPHGKEHLVEQV